MANWQFDFRRWFPKQTCESHGCGHGWRDPNDLDSNLCHLCRLEITMSKSEYELIAREIAASYKKYDNEPALVDVALHLAAEFEKQNPRFSRPKFLIACGMPLLV